MDISKLNADAFFNLDSFDHAALFENCRYVWEGLREAKDYLNRHLNANVKAVGCFRQPLPQTVLLWRGPKSARVLMSAAAA